MIKQTVWKVFIIKMSLEILLSLVSIDTPIDQELVVSVFIIPLLEQV